MNISRIEAYNPVIKINWQILTARQILDYKNLGAEVPDVYLNWAKEFIVSIQENDNDTITYKQDVQQKSLQEINKVAEEDDNIENTIVLEEEPVIKKENEEVVRSVNSAKNEASEKVISANDDSIKYKQKVQTLEQQMQKLFQDVLQNQSTLNLEVLKMDSKESFSYQKILDLQNQLASYNNQGKANIYNESIEITPLEVKSDLNSQEILNNEEFGNFELSKSFNLISQEEDSSILEKSIRRFQQELPQRFNNEKNKEPFEEKENNLYTEDILDISKASLDEILKRKIRRGEVES